MHSRTAVSRELPLKVICGPEQDTSATYLSRQIHHLDQDAKQLLGMFSYAGDCLPAHFFERAYNSLVWGPNGQPMSPGTGAPKDHERLLRLLTDHGFVIPLPNNGKDTTILIHPDVTRQLSTSSEPDKKRWKLLAINAILHAYPKDAQLSPVEYAQDIIKPNKLLLILN